MYRFLLAGLLLMGTVTPAAVRGDKGPEALDGTWSLVSVEIDKNPLDMKQLKGARLTVRGEKYDFRLGDVRLELTYRAYPENKPRAIDLTLVAGPDKGKTFRGIYKLEGDVYTVCRHTQPGRERPTRFETRPKSGLMLVVWKRDKR